MAEPIPATSLGTRTEFARRTWPANARQLAAIRSALRAWLTPLVLAVDVEDDVVLAVNEAASNGIEHAYAPGTRDGTVELTFWTEHRSVCIEVVDHGTWQTPSGTVT